MYTESLSNEANDYEKCRSIPGLLGRTAFYHWKPEITLKNQPFEEFPADISLCDMSRHQKTGPPANGLAERSMRAQSATRAHMASVISSLLPHRPEQVRPFRP
jgi:hypothetical protein